MSVHIESMKSFVRESHIIDESLQYDNNNANNANNAGADEDVLRNLYPALAQCVFVIFVGYSTGRIQLIPSGGIKGTVPLREEGFFLGRIHSFSLFAYQFRGVGQLKRQGRQF